MLVPARGVQQRGVDGRRARQDGDLLLLDQPQRLRDVERALQDHRGALQHAREHARLVAERVEHRVDDEVPVAGLHARAARPRLVRADVLLVRAHDALGLARRPGREQDVGDAARPDGRGPRVGLLARHGFARELVPGDDPRTRRPVERDNGLQRGQAGDRTGLVQAEHAGVVDAEEAVLDEEDLYLGLESGQRASSPLKRVLSGTSVAPAPMAPSTVTIQDSPLGAQIAIRSPARPRRR